MKKNMKHNMKQQKNQKITENQKEITIPYDELVNDNVHNNILMMFDKLEEVIKEYKKNNNNRGATAFALKFKERFELIADAEKDLINKKMTPKDKRRFLQLIDCNINIVKKEIDEILSRENIIPNYIG